MATAEQIARAREVARQRASGAINYSQTSPTTAPTTNRPPTTPSSGLGTTTTQANNTGLSQSVMDEIRRKAQAGIKLTNPNAASSALYNQYSQPSTTGQAMQPSQMNKPFTTGSNIIGYNPNNTIQNKIAELGSKWQTASPEERTALAAQAQALGQSAGGVFNPGTGTWVFPNQQGQPDGQQQYDPNMFSSANFIRERQRLAEEAARQQAYEASNLADAQSLQGGQRLQEVLAARGLGASGENITATAQQQAARQGALTDIQNQLAGNIRDIGAQAQQQLLEDLYRSQDIARQKEQQDREYGLAVSDRTGVFLPEGAQQEIDNIQRLKKLAETKGISKEQLASLNAAANKSRAKLDALGVESSLFGADVTSSKAGQNIGKAGIKTLAGRGLEFEQDITKRQLDRADYESDRDFEFAKGQQAWENNFKTGQFNWQKAQQAWENTFQEKNFQQQMEEAAASRGLQWASLSQRDKEFIADLAFREKQFSYGVEQDALKNAGGGADLTELGRYFDGVAQRDPDTGGITNPDQLENAILNDVSTSSYQKYQLYNRYGLTWGGEIPSPN